MQIGSISWIVVGLIAGGPALVERRRLARALLGRMKPLQVHVSVQVVVQRAALLRIGPLCVRRLDHQRPEQLVSIGPLVASGQVPGIGEREHLLVPAVSLVLYCLVKDGQGRKIVAQLGVIVSLL